MMLALSVIHSNNTDQLDVKTAFLNAQVKEDIYIEAPDGINITDKQVLKLNKALYGIKQAPREWNENINAYLTSLEFHRCRKDPCIYIKVSKNNHNIILGLFVDDILVSYNNKDKDEWYKYKQQLKKQYELSDLGEVQHILGMRITRKNDGKQIYIDQQVYINEKLKQYGMNESRGISAPEANNIKLVECEEDELLEQPNEYRGMVRSLIYASISTRPDITHTVNMLSRYMSKPGKQHKTAAKRVLRYLNTTSNYGIVYNSNKNDNDNSEIVITAYSDADWGGSEDRKSTTGYCVFINDNLISWNTKKQQTIALSTAEAEFMAATEVVKEVKWLTQILQELNYKVQKPILVFIDNQSAIKIGENDVEHDRTKHIDIKYYFIRDSVYENEIKLVYVPTDEQIADIFTKAVTPKVHNKFRDIIMSAQ